MMAATTISSAANDWTGWLRHSGLGGREGLEYAIKKPRLYKQHLHGKGGTRGIMRLSISEFGPAFVHSRNLTFKDLSGRQIKVVGCGAIGSYVALSLVRLGAGANGGKLMLIDPDKLKPENIGRHVLGYPALFKSKATALRDELVRQFPFSTIDASPTGSMPFRVERASIIWLRPGQMDEPANA